MTAANREALYLRPYNFSNDQAFTHQGDNSSDARLPRRLADSPPPPARPLPRPQLAWSDHRDRQRCHIVACVRRCNR
jgi:hypothetical protein